MPGAPAAAPLRHLALGDSYTVGEGVAADASWPAQLRRQLHRDGIAMAPPRIVAVTGWTTDELAAGMEAASLAPAWDLVTLQIGVNNQYRGRAAATYREEFAQLLRRAIALAGDRPARVVVVSIPDWGMTRFAREQGRDGATIAAELDAYNALARAETAQDGARWVDVTALSRRHADAVVDDGLHPSAAQYAAWVEAIAPAARAALRSAATTAP
ncbi:SGNH/GDSL hydrolase family protein [Rhodanobacter caeni]|uniref:SGNH/GDSL hydrolase family protein n=1 Tax=Rhodanobacter caeni TaxID=657654 RepID=A0ABN0UH10_9GAMM